MRVVNAQLRFDRIQFFLPGGKELWLPAVYDFFVPKGSGWQRVSCRSWEDRKNRLEKMESDGVQTFEGDVNPVRRYFVDHPETQIAEPQAVYLDFEADSRATFFQHTTGRSRVLCWTIKGKQDKMVVHHMLQSDDDDAERDLLNKLWYHLENYEQVLAWNGGMVESDILKSQHAKHGFDFYVLIRRSQNLGVLPKWWRKLLYLDHLACFKRNNMNSGDADEKISFGLDAIGEKFTGKRKVEFDSSRCWEEWVAGGTRRDRLGEYNIGDVELESEIENATGYLAVFQSLCDVTWCFPDTAALQPTRQVDGLMLNYGNKMGVHYKTKKYGGGGETVNFAGAYCDGPYVDGMSRDVHVADFKSLYPSIMISCNISPELLDRPGVTCPVDKGSKDECSVDGNITFDSSVVGVLPTCVKDVLALREEWKQRAKKFPKGSPEEQEASRKSMAYKMACNSFMGVACSPYSRYYSVKLGLAICRTGVALIQAARDAATARGWKVIYIDTDSLFVVGPTVEQFKEFTQSCNTELFPKLASSWGCPTNTFFLDYEKAFEKVLFTWDSTKRKYNRKKYAYRLAHKGFTPPKPGKEVDVVGIEMKRGDSSKLARGLQKKVIGRLMAADACTPEEILKIIEEYRIFVFHTDHPVQDVFISKSIRKDIEGYGEKQLPHLIAARMLAAKGREIREGTKVQFVVTCGSKSNPKYTGNQEIVLAEDYTGALDRYFLWETSVWPATYRLVKAAFPGDVRFEQFNAPSGKAVKYAKAERAGQLTLFG